MKGIYTPVNGRVYRVNQDTKSPVTDVMRIGTNSMSVKSDVSAKTTVAEVYLTDFDPATMKSNKDNYDDLVAFLTDNEITEIKTLENAFFVSVDYTILNAEEKEIEHSVVIKPMKVKDFIYPLGVNKENECVYRRFKHLSMYIEWIVMNKLPYGIMCNKNSRTYIRINDITFWQDKFVNEDEHQSVYSQPYNRNKCSCTINSSLENKIPVFSTKGEGIELQEIVNNFQPRVIGLNLNVDITKLIVVYNSDEIDTILRVNKGEVPPALEPTPDDSQCDCGCSCKPPIEPEPEEPDDPSCDCGCDCDDMPEIATDEEVNNMLNEVFNKS